MSKASAAIFAVTLTVAPLCAAANSLTAQKIFANVSPSVVVVKSENLAGKALAQGSGVVVKANEVATNCHVVEGAERLRVKHQGKLYPAAVKFADTERDLCLLEVANLPAKPVTLGAADVLSVGDQVYAIGSPQGLELSLSSGIVSQLRGAEKNVAPIIQTTAPISPGSSGGGLFDANGRLVGITTLLMKESQNLNFAIPADWIAELPARQELVQAKPSALDSNTARPVQADPVDEEAAKQASLEELVEELARLVPDWSSYYQDERFVHWLDEIEPGTGQSRKENMRAKALRHDFRGVANVFTTWQQVRSQEGGWVGVAAGDGGTTVYMDRRLIRIQDGYVVAWELQDFEQPRFFNGQQYRSSKVFYAYDCARQSAAIITRVSCTDQMGGGESTRSINLERYQWKFVPAIPGSVGEATADFVCSNRPK